MKVKFTLKKRNPLLKINPGDSVILELSNLNTVPANGQLKEAIESQHNVSLSTSPSSGSDYWEKQKV
jgi:hypothetical protein